MPLVTPTGPVPLADLGRVHFIGIGGAGMSGIARIMLSRGTGVSGSDSADSAALADLAALGAKVHAGHDAANVGDADTVVVSSAIRDGNPELAEARRRGLRVLHRSAALAALMHGRRVIAVTGTHGKTTTTSMIATALLEAGADPGYVIGGVLAASGTGAADGGGPYFVAEADESDGSFLNYEPDVAVITSIEADHLDNYGTPAAYRESFRAFAARLRPGAVLVSCADDPGARDLARYARTLGLTVRCYGEAPDAGYRVTAITGHGMRTEFTVTAAPRPASPAPPASGTAPEPAPGPGTPRELRQRLSVGVPGRHNALNAAAAFAVAVELGIAPQAAAAALGRYAGAARRMEPKGEASGVRVLDTYAHHPTEIAADLRAARDIAAGQGRVIAVFQPHLYSRTRIFAADFGAALGLADQALVLDVYPAREDPEPGVTGALVADAAPGARYLPDPRDVPAAVAALAAPGDIVLLMGAGDVTRLSGPVLAELAR
jgi:UDP-N-acetylmuramate--alanine ligase